MVLDDGYAWNGCVYRSLSQVAKAITGTNWNGHRFFGLKAVRNGAPNRKRSATPGPNPLLDIGMSPSPTLAGFAPAMPDGSPPLAAKRSDSTAPRQYFMIHAGAITTGSARTDSVVGLYWMISASSVRLTTMPLVKGEVESSILSCSTINSKT